MKKLKFDKSTLTAILMFILLGVFVGLCSSCSIIEDIKASKNAPDPTFSRFEFPDLERPKEKIQIYQDPTLEYDYRLDFALIFDALWKEYETYCYNDSTEILYDWFQITDNIRAKSYPSFDPGFDPSYIGTWSIYEHRQPTLEDFANWNKNIFIPSFK